jgi:sterol desaturase/sphingolipid hydroxylase (fatty acid hydroxylase superfamily)
LLWGNKILEMSVEIITTIIFFSAAAIIILLERLFPYTKGMRFFRDGWWMDFVWYTLIQSYLLKILIFDYIIAPVKVHFGIENYGVLSHLPVWALVLIFLVGHDFYIYWFHRLQHVNKYVWRLHEAHHSVTEVDWLAGSRSHFLEIIVNQTIEFAPIILLLDNHTAAIVVPIKALIDAVWGMWIHSNIDVHSGKLQYVINGPEMHQWHHSDYRPVFFMNYATKFAIWDWIFGTGFLPGLQPFSHQYLKPPKFGLPYDFPREYFAQQWFLFHRFDVKNFETKPLIKTYIEWKKPFIRLFVKEDETSVNPNPTE